MYSVQMTKIKQLTLSFICLIFLISCSPSEDSSVEITTPSKDSSPKKVKRNTGDEIILSCKSNEGMLLTTLALKQNVNECNSSVCVNWTADVIMVEHLTFDGFTNISRKDLSLSALWFTPGTSKSNEYKGYCEIVENNNVL